jgi:hypothetical protein
MSCLLLSTRQGLVHIQQPELNTYQYALTFCTTGVSSLLMSVRKVSNCKQLQYFAASYKHAGCNTE